LRRGETAPKPAVYKRWNTMPKQTLPLRWSTVSFLPTGRQNYKRLPFTYEGEAPPSFGLV
jgi:hypothetical protein